MPYSPSLEKSFMVNPEKVEKALRDLVAY